MGIFKPLFTESNSYNDKDKLFRGVTNNDEDVSYEDICPEESQQLLKYFQEKIKVAEAQSASGVPRTSLDDAINKLRKMINE